MNFKQIKKDKRNYRKHNEENKRLIQKSIEECGFGRSIVIDNNDEVICGNGVVSSITDNTNIKLVETDGSELIVIKRKDLNRDDEKRNKLAILDNSTNELSSWDYDLLNEDFDEDYLNNLSINIIDNNFEIEDEDTEDSDEQNQEQINKSFRVTYEICFNDEIEQEHWYRFLQVLKKKYPQLETISERILVVTDNWVKNNE